MSGSINQTRVDVLGVSVDNSTTWTLAPPNNANRLNTAERIVTRAINALDLSVTGAIAGTNGFAGRFGTVIGNETTGADQTAFAAIGKNLIQAVHELMTTGGGGGGGVKEFDQTTPALQWNLQHDFGQAFVEVRVMSPGGSDPDQTLIIPARIEYLDADSCRLTFLQPVAGTAIVRR